MNLKEGLDDLPKVFGLRPPPHFSWKYIEIDFLYVFWGFLGVFFFQVPPSCINFPVPIYFVFDICIFCLASFIYYLSVN